MFSTGRAFVADLMADNAGELMQVIRCFEDGGNPFAGDTADVR